MSSVFSSLAEVCQDQSHCSQRVKSEVIHTFIVVIMSFVIKKQINIVINFNVSGLEVPDFQTMRKSGKVSFDRSAYDLPHNTIQYHTVLHNLWKLSTRATPTAFHTLMDSIASDGRLLRHYTQNINCIEQSLPDLYERTVQLHVASNEMLCQYCG